MRRRHGFTRARSRRVRPDAGAKPADDDADAGRDPDRAARKNDFGQGPRPAPRESRRLQPDGRGRLPHAPACLSSATVRGTRWVVVDRCDGTLTRVVRGIVAVQDFPQGEDRSVFISTAQPVPGAGAPEGEKVSSGLSLPLPSLITHIVSNLPTTDRLTAHPASAAASAAPLARHALVMHVHDLHTSVRPPPSCRSLGRLDIGLRRSCAAVVSSSSTTLIVDNQQLRHRASLPRPASGTSKASTSGSPPRSTSRSSCCWRCGSWRCSWRPREQRTPCARLLLIAAAAASSRLASRSRRAAAACRLASINKRFGVRGSQGPPYDVVIVAFDEDVRGPGRRWPFPAGSTPRRSALTRGRRPGDRLRRAVHRARPGPSADDDTADPGGPTSRTRSWPRPRSTRRAARRALRRRARPALQPPTHRTPTTRTAPDGRIRHVRSSIDGLETFRWRRAGTARRQAAASLRATAPDRLSRAHAEPAPDQLRRHLRGQVQRDAESAARSWSSARRPRAPGPAPDLDLRRRPMAGPEIQAGGSITVLDGFPLAAAPGWLDTLSVRRSAR